LALQPSENEAIVPPLEYVEVELVEPPPRRRRRLPIWARLILLLLAGIWLTVFVIGMLLSPYDRADLPNVSASTIAVVGSPDGMGPYTAAAAFIGEESVGRQVPKMVGTHRGPPLNLPDCTFKELTGLPCPSCGMTTSFSMLVHGDVWNSLRANFAGTALATLGLLYIPWSLASAWRGRFLFIRSLEMTLFRLSVAFMILLFGRWGIALAVAWFTR
jgi:hypothetical protein